MARDHNNSQGPIVIKKYSNRRLYDSTHKRYVTLEDISDMIRDGDEVRVIDSQTGEDISKVILIQVILESEKNKEDILPVSFLHMLIKYGNKIAKDFFENYFLMMFQPYLSVQENMMKKNIKMWKDIGWFPPGLKLPESFENFGGAGDEPSTDDTEDGNSDHKTETRPRSNKTIKQQSQEVELLLRKIKQLEDKVDSLDKEK